MNSKQEGMILLTTLMMLTLLTLLVLSQMQLVFLYYKTLNRHLERQQSFYQMEAVANRLLLNQAGLKNSSCSVESMEPDAIIELLKKKQGCRFIQEKELYFYLIENLGFFPCLQTVFKENSFSTQHLRLTIMTDGENAQVLQLRTANLAQLATCAEKPTLIKTGLISWRYLPIIV